MKRRIITRSLVGIMLILFFTSLIAYISNSTYYNATIAEKNQLIVNNWVEPSINRYPVDDLRWKFPSDLSFDKYSGDAYRWEPPADLYANSYRFDPSSTENDSTESNYSNQDSTTSLDYETSDFIYITGDSDFGPANYNFPGSGTQIDPYRIEGYNITGSSADLIHIEGTTAYFVIYHNLLDGMNGYYQGIFLYNVTNGYIDSNIICNSSAGLSMIFTSHNTIMDNDIYGSDNGMVANASYYNFISSNYIHDNVNDGFVFHGSYNNITGNTFSDNGNFGLYILAYSYNNAVQNNSFINNQAGRLSQAIDDSATSTYVYEYSRAPDNIDPATNWDTIGSGINELLYETLVYYNGELASELEGCLATNWDVSPSGMNYTFYLRSDVIFHDGTPFNAYVMKYSLDRAVIMNDPSGPAWMLSDYILGGPEYTSYPDPNVNHSLEYLAAGGVVVVDDYTLLINLDRGYTPFTQILAYRVGAAVSPKAVVDNRPLDYVTDMSDEDFCMVPLDQWFPDLSGDYTKLGLPVDHDSGISGVVAGSGGYSVNAHDWMMTHAVGTGPYKLVEWTSNSMIMEKNIGWWGAFASDSADEVQILFVSDITDRINHLKLGYADQVQMYVSEVDQIVDEYGQPVIEGTNVYTHPSFTLSFFGYNVHDSLPVEFINESLDSTYNPASNQKYSWGTETAGSNPFSALEFRKAFSYVFDYDSFVQTLKGYEERMEGVIPNGIIGHYELLAENGYIPPYDPATAKTFLENVGWKGTIKLVYNTENSVRQLVCEQLESTIESLNVGIEIEVEGVIWPDYLDYWFNGEIPIPVMAWAPDYADPDNYVKAFLHSSGFFSQITGYSNAALDSLIENATTEQDTSIREDLYQQIEETAASDYCVIYGCQSHLVEVTRDWVTGFAESGSLNPMSNMPNIESISDTGVNWFDHNYYSDWTGPDADQDGIVDDPYTIDGNALNVDLNPVTPFPEFTSIPDDIVFESGTGDVFLTWIATDDNPATYNIGIGVNIIESGTWMSGVPITFNAGQLEGFETPMHYNMTIEVFDEVGHSISDWAIVTVLPSSPWTPHAPIYIDSNADFGPSGYNFPGSGTQSDPYLIEWYNITSSVNALIEIRNTDVYFQISHCLLNGVMIDYYRGIYLYNVRNGNISNNIIQFSSWGIELRSSSNINITGNTVSDCTHYGIFVGSSNDITLNGNTCYDIVYGGIYLSYCSNCLLVVNTCYNIDRNGIILTDSSYCTLIGNTCYSNMEGILPARSSNLIISENTCYGNSNTGIKLGLDVVGQIGANHCTITNNTCYNNYGGIFTRNSANNNITDNNLYGNSQDGIRLYDSSSNILANNTCNDNALGITVLGVSNYNILKNNTCYNNDQYPGYGIFVSQMGVGVPVNNTLDGNTCYDNEKAGIVIWFSDNNILTGNRVYNNERGFWIYDSNDNILKSDNNCYSNNYGIYVEHTSSYNTVTGTSISGNTYHGILLMTDASFNVIEGNFFIDNNPQAYDYGLNNTFSHNYWNDWTTPDSDMDGIVDIPYAIGGTAGNTDPYPLAHFYTSHEPIYIDDNSDFIALGFPGTGILSDPYRIEGYEITNSTTNLIHVQDTTVYFVIRNNLLNGTDGSNDGIVLNNVIYGTVENNIIHSSNNGIYLSYSDNNELIGNTVLENAGYGIYLWTSSYNDLIGNNVTGNDLNGIILASSSDNSLIGNTASGNNHGFELSSSNYNNLEDNTATGNSYIGFIGTGSNYNTLTGNTATGHGNYGFALYSSSFNVLTGNTAGGNTGHGFYVWNAFWGSSHNNTLIENSASGNRDGFFLDGASTNNLTGNTATGNTWGFSLTSSSYNNLTGNIASGNTYHGFYLFSSHSNTLDDNTASGNGNDGFYLDDSDSNSLTGNTASSNGDDGFYVFLARYNKLTGNTASENTEEGFYLYSSSIYNNLTGNTASGNYHGFWIYSCYYNTLTGNTASSNTLYGFYVTSASSNNILTGNTASGNNRGFALQHAVENVLIDNTATGSYDGFYLGNSDNNNLTGNTASGNTNGFYVLASSGNALFDNTATGNSWFSFILHHSLSNYNILSWNTAQGGQYGIAIYDSSHYNTLTNNIAKENEEGFYLYNSGNNSLIENAAYNNTKNGIYLVDSIGNNLTGNYAFNNSFKGIYLYNSSYNGITGNTIYDNGEDGIFLKDSDYNTITNNIVFDNGYGTGTAGASTVYSSKVAGMTIGSGMFIDPSVGNVLTDNYVFNNSINGIYLLGSNETIILNNIIYGNGEDGVFLKDSNYNTITGNALFDNGYGGSTSGSSSTAYSSKVAGMTIGSGMFIDPSVGNVLTGNYVFNNSINGIYLLGSSNTNISDNSIYGNGEDGVFLKDSNYNIITGNALFDNGYGGSTSGSSSTAYSSKVAGMTIGSGMFIDPSVGNVLTGNYVFNNSINGIYLLGSSETDILNNTVYDNGEDGVFLKDSNYNTITGNALFNNGYGTTSTSGSSSTAYSSKVAGMTIGSGMFIDPSVGNVLTGNYVFNNSINGIYLLGSSETDILNNTVYDNGEDGVFLKDSNYNTITGNALFDNGYGTTSTSGSSSTGIFSGKIAGMTIGSGMFIDPSVGNVLTGNSVFNNSINGIYLLGSSNTNISSNGIYDNGEDGVFLKDSNYNTISTNAIFHNGYGGGSSGSSSTGIFSGKITGMTIGSGMFIDPSVGNVITGNSIFNNFINGIYLLTATDTIISGNDIYSNGEDGIFLQDTSTSDISSNVIHDNELYGINIDSDSSDNSVSSNDLIANNLEGTSQAYDDGTDNTFTENFFIDHDNTDSDGDGIADEPYLIDGSASNTDETPQSLPVQPPDDMDIEIEDIAAIINIDPDTLNLKNEGKWITVTITLPGDYSVTNLNISTIHIDNDIYAEKPCIRNQTTIIVKFDRQDLIDYLESLEKTCPYDIDINVTGRFNGDLLGFNGSDSIHVINEGEVKKTYRWTEEHVKGTVAFFLLFLPFIFELFRRLKYLWKWK